MPERSLKLANQECVTEGYYTGRYTFRFQPYTGTHESTLCILLAGQGGVYPGMFKEALQEFDLVKERFSQADQIAKSLGLPSISKYVLSPDSLTDQERYQIQNICLFTGEVALYDVLKAKGIRPRVFTAHSFGEYAALTCAGVLSFEDMFKFVCFREKVAPPKNERGFLMAVNGDSNKVANWLENLPYHIANKNSESQTVIAIAPADVDAITTRLEELGIRKKLLPTPQPYHSPLLNDMPSKLEKYLDDQTLSFAKPEVAVFSSVTHQLLDPDHFSDASVRTILTRQMTEPVDFVDQVSNIIQSGCQQFIEIGPGVVLGPFVEAVSSSVKVTPIDHYVRLSRRKRSDGAGSALQKSKAWGTINKIISRVTGYQIEDISLEDKFQEDLGIDSIKKTEIIFSVLEEVEGDPNQALDTANINQVKDLITFAQNRKSSEVSTAREVSFSRYSKTWSHQEIFPFGEEKNSKITWIHLPKTIANESEAQSKFSELMHAEIPPTFVLNIPEGIDTFERKEHLERIQFLQKLLSSHQGLFECNLVVVSSTKANPVARAYTAFFKALKKEFPEFFLKSIQFDDTSSKELIERTIQQELQDPTEVDILYKNSERHVQKLEKLAESEEIELTQESVIVAIGGAKGITFSLVKDLCQQKNGHFYLWGRSPESKVKDNLAELHSFHRKVTYCQVDATDPQVVKQQLSTLVKNHGKVDWVFNGAGIEVSQLLKSKTAEEIIQEMESKVLPVTNVLSAAESETNVVQFSSVVSDYGNKGQTIYAFANAWADALCEIHGATTILWPPWNSVGMTAKSGIINALKSQGVALLEKEQASKLFQQELKQAQPGRVAYADASDKLRYGFPLKDSSQLRFIGDASATASGVQLKRAFSLESDPYLKDHLVDGKAYVPGAVGASFFLCLSKFVNGEFSVLSELKLMQPVVVEGGRVPFTVSYDLDANLRLQTSTPHFVASVKHTTPIENAELPAPDFEIQPKSIYSSSALFHGPSFQGIVSAQLHGKSGISLAIESSKMPKILDRGPFGRLAQWIDLAFQGVALFGLAEHTGLYLPTAVGAIQVSDHLTLDASLRMTIEIAGIKENVLMANATLLGKDSYPLKLQGIEMSLKEKVSKHKLKIKKLK